MDSQDAQQGPDIGGLTFIQLRELGAKVQAEIRVRMEAERVALLDEFEQRAAALGFSLEDLVQGVRRVKAKRFVAAKYVNPANSTQTWSGRGRKPLWFVNALAAGAKVEDLAVKGL